MPADKEVVPVPSLAAARDDAGIESGEAAAAAEALLDDDDGGGLLLALEIVFGVAAGLGLVVALWFRRRTA